MAAPSRTKTPALRNELAQDIGSGWSELLRCHATANAAATTTEPAVQASRWRDGNDWPSACLARRDLRPGRVKMTSVISQLTDTVTSATTAPIRSRSDVAPLASVAD